jgi:selenocysteine lyase/cysteine desulfurase
MLRELNGHQPMPWRAVSRLREASDQVAAFLGSLPDDLVFVPNVTTGLNAVLGSLLLGPGDDVMITELLEDRLEVQLHAWRGRLWTRVSAQIYNDHSDIARLADAVARRS